MDTSRIIGVSFTLAIACLSGCGTASSSSTSTPSSTASNPGGLTAAVRDYRAGRYREAQTQAVQAHEVGGASAEEASYLAGLSALRQDNLAQADRLLRAASTSSDVELAGRAKRGPRSSKYHGQGVRYRKCG